MMPLFVLNPVDIAVAAAHDVVTKELAEKVVIFELTGKVFIKSLSTLISPAFAFKYISVA